jgi:hypothetical membrane protein
MIASNTRSLTDARLDRHAAAQPARGDGGRLIRTKLAAVQSSRRDLGVAGVLWITAALVFVLFEGLAAAAVQPSYSYVTGYISDLGVPARSPSAALMNTAFWVQGVMFAAGAVLIARTCGGGRLFMFLAVVNAVGNILVAVAHGGSALVANGYGWLHVLGALLAIVGGNAAIIVGSSVAAKTVALRGYRSVSIALAVVGFVCLAMLTVTTSTSGLPSGAPERGSVYSILAWQAFTGLVLLARPARTR